MTFTARPPVVATVRDWVAPKRLEEQKSMLPILLPVDMLNRLNRRVVHIRIVLLLRK